MSKAPVRTAQFVSPFGPGALYTNADGHVLLIAGLDPWFKCRNNNSDLIQAEDRNEFIVEDARLSGLLGGVRFFRAPDHRGIRQNQKPPRNAGITVPAVRFPTWYRNRHGNALKKTLNYWQKEAHVCLGVPKGESWLPVRFVAACEHGHLNEFPWKEWSGCTCPDDKGLRLDDRGGTGLESIRIHCEHCKKWKTLQGTTQLPPDDNQPTEFGKAGIVCGGGRPWLGYAHESCGSKRMVAVLLGQSNLYIAQTASSLKLPTPDDLSSDAGKIFAFLQDDENKEFMVQQWQFGNKEAALSFARIRVNGNAAGLGMQRSPGDDAINEALAAISGDRPLSSSGATPAQPEPEEVTFRRAEYEILTRPTPPDRPELEVVVVESPVPEGLERWISKVNRIEKLTEVRALCGFSRLRENPIRPLRAVAEHAAKQFFRNPPAPDKRWLPAVQVSGEGIFVQLAEKEFHDWYNGNEVTLDGRLGPLWRMAEEPRLMPPSVNADKRWAARFLLTHTFSHLLINQLVFECGYSSSALRERLYVSQDPVAPMMATLIYTAQGDSEGTLGGLVNLGHADRFEGVVRRALSKASWCSADPVCSEAHGAGGARRLNLAACHSCSLLPETACETINDGLDRGVVVGTPDERNLGFFSGLL